MGPAVSWFPQVFVENESVLGHRAGNGEREREREWLTGLFLVSFCSLLQLGIYKLLLTCFRYIYIYMYISLFKQISRSIFLKLFVKAIILLKTLILWKKIRKQCSNFQDFSHRCFFCQAKSLERRGPAKGGGVADIDIIFKHPRNFRVWSMM